MKVYMILGPTASGKTAVAVELAKMLDGEVISADSMQIYREMNIGTAKPDMAEQQGIAHHLIDVVAPDEHYSVAQFQQQAKDCIRALMARGKTPIVAGGTGLYLNALTYQLDFTGSNHDEQLREELEQHSNEELYARLQEQDAAAAQRIHSNDRKRLIRRLEILAQGGDEGYDFKLQNNDEFDFAIYGLTMERALLYERINQRVDLMIHQGLLEEVQSVVAQYGKDGIAMQAIGYKEIIQYMDGAISLERATEILKQNTRRFAKRQMTWFRRDERIRWLDVTAYQSAKNIAEAMIKER